MRTKTTLILLYAFFIAGFVRQDRGGDIPATQPRSTKDQIQSLVDTIDVDPDILHNDDTPSVEGLISSGVMALKPCLKLMLSNDPDTRTRAERAIDVIVCRMFGFEPGQGWSLKGGEDDYRALLKTLGPLSFDQPLEDRKKAVEKWSAWADVVCNGRSDPASKAP